MKDMKETPVAGGSFTVRLSPNDYKILVSMANLQNTTVAALARSFIRSGMKASLKPDEIEKAIERERQRLLAAAAEWSAEPEDDEY